MERDWTKKGRALFTRDLNRIVLDCAPGGGLECYLRLNLELSQEYQGQIRLEEIFSYAPEREPRYLCHRVGHAVSKVQGSGVSTLAK